jgi:pyruvate kinase
MDKKAKILATLGPAIFKKNIINNLIRSGVDGFRINFSHNLTGIEKIVKIIRDCEKINSKPIAIVADLQGIKLRIGKIFGNQVSLKRGDTFNFDLNKKIGSQSRVYLPYPEIFKKIKKSNKILIDDGKFVFKITKLSKNSIQTVCQNDCIIKNFKSIHIPGLEVDFDNLTTKDKHDIQIAKKTKLQLDCIILRKEFKNY